jgi:DnaK suppressor protein
MQPAPLDQLAAEPPVMRPGDQPASGEEIWRRGMETMRGRLEAERRDAIEKLQQIRGAGELTAAETGGVEDAIEGGDRAQANLRQHIEVTTCQRLAERIGRLSEALHRLDEGTYGRCEHCDRTISPKRLAAVPEATTCVSCQEALELMARRRLLAA